MASITVASNIVASARSSQTAAERRRHAAESAAPMRRSAGPDAFWRSLNYFNIYRLGVAAVFFFSFHYYGNMLNLGHEAPRLYLNVSVTYLLFASLFFILLQNFRHAFRLQLISAILTDIFALTLLMFASGGTKSGMALMLLVVLAGAGLVGQGRLTLFFAAVASLAILFEQTYRALNFDGEPADFVRAGITSISFFATAISAHLLANRVVANEDLARRRGEELTNQLRINQRVIHDMQDGVLVVDAQGSVRQFNPQAENLLGINVPEYAALATFSPVLAKNYANWNRDGIEASETLRTEDGGRLLRVRFLPAGEGGNALIYIEDLDRVIAQAQQIKLAALGRLTANLAHEIRNPLSSISYAAELLAEESRDETQTRLTRIINDNTQRLNRLVGEVLQLGRRNRAQPETLQLDAFFANFLDEFTPNGQHIQETVALKIDTLARLSFDRSHLHQVLCNLVGNALRHCRNQNGSVRIEVRHPTVMASGGTTQSAAAIEIHVIDDGSGIEPELRSQVFEPFFTTHSSGTGLGLYIARELCEANGAQLEVQENSPGAHFCLTGKGE